MGSYEGPFDIRRRNFHTVNSTRLNFAKTQIWIFRKNPETLSTFPPCARAMIPLTATMYRRIYESRFNCFRERKKSFLWLKIKISFQFSVNFHFISSLALWPSWWSLMWNIFMNFSNCTIFNFHYYLNNRRALSNQQWELSFQFSRLSVVISKIFSVNFEASRRIWNLNNRPHDTNRHSTRRKILSFSFCSWASNLPDSRKFQMKINRL